MIPGVEVKGWVLGGVVVGAGDGGVEDGEVVWWVILILIVRAAASGFSQSSK